MQIEFDFVGAVTAIAVLLYGAGRYINRHYLRHWSSKMSMMFLAVPKIEKIYEQVTPNGGSSLRDAIDRIEQRTVSLEQKQVAFMMDTRHGVFETNEEGRYIWVNRTFCRMLGKSESELLGRSWVNCIPEIDRERVLKSWSYAVENNIEFNMVFTMIDNDKVERAVHVHANPMIDGKKRLIGYLGLVEETI